MNHTCHWPGCDRIVPPKLWGCRPHWFALPQALRDLIWATYRRGQEVTKTPTREYVQAARQVQDWIATNAPKSTRPMLPALSIRQPWAWLIVHGYKDIENREWETVFRGHFLVHAGQTFTRPYFNEVVHWMDELGLCPPTLPCFEDLKAQTGGIVGHAHIVNCMATSTSKWHMPEHFGFALANPSPLPFRPWKGRLGFFNVPRSAVPV